MNLQKGKRALVTGASSGIGLAFAEALAARGLNLVLVARTGDKLQELAARLAKEHGVQADVLVTDLGKPGAAKQVFEAVKAHSWNVDLLVNNAGYGRWGDFLEFPTDDYAAMVQLNITSLVELCHAFLSGLIQNKGLGIINVGSTASLLPVPYAGVYSASKAFVLMFSEALWGEYGHTGVHIMTLCPGATSTKFAEVANAGVAAKRGAFGATPESVVADALKAFEKGKTYVVSGGSNYFTAAVLPRLMTRRAVIGLVGKVFRKTAKGE